MRAPLRVNDHREGSEAEQRTDRRPPRVVRRHIVTVPVPGHDMEQRASNERLKCADGRERQGRNEATRSKVTERRRRPDDRYGSGRAANAVTRANEPPHRDADRNAVQDDPETERADGR